MEKNWKNAHKRKGSAFLLSFKRKNAREIELFIIIFFIFGFYHSCGFLEMDFSS